LHRWTLLEHEFGGGAIENTEMMSLFEIAIQLFVRARNLAPKKGLKVELPVRCE
jgi:hypothetical protein